ncbi:MAG: hypothetical protein ABIV06_11115, partial [Thermoanaerobaculia bacterium]
AEIAPLADSRLLAGVGVAALFALIWAFGWIFLARRLAAGLGEPTVADPRTAASCATGSG